MDSLINMRLAFNRYLLDAIGGSILNSSIFAWDGGIGLTKYMLALCMAVAFFQSVLKSEKTMLVEWTKIIIASWFCLAILGGIDATKQVPFGAMNSALTKDYKITSGKATLDRIVFNYMSMKFDRIGQILMGQDENGKGGNDLSKEMNSLNNLQDKFIYALGECDAKNGAVCMKEFLTSSDPSALKDKKNAEAKANGSLAGKALGMVPGAETAALIASAFAKIYLMFQFPILLIFPLALFFLKLATAFVNFFVLLAFGITAAMSLFMIKVLCVFMVIPSYRDRVISMFKVGLSAALYGFAMNLMLWISFVITRALNEATGNIVIDQLTNPAVGKGEFALMIGQVIISNFLVSFVILCMQIVAMTKVPKFTRNLMDLSLEELVNIGDTLFTAGLGVAKLAGGLAVGMGGLAAGLGGGVAAGLAKTQAGGAVSSLGSNMGQGFRKLLGGGSDPGGPQDFGGGGGPVGSPPSRGGGSDLNSIASGAGNVQATVKTTNNTPILADKDDGEDDKTKKTGALTENEKRAKKDAQISSSLTNLKTGAKALGGKVGGSLLDMAMGGLAAGAGDGNFMSSLEGATKRLTDKDQDGKSSFDRGSDSLRTGAESSVDWVGNSFKGQDIGERAAVTNDINNQLATGKTDMSFEDSKKFDQNMADISSGNVSNANVKEMLAAQNTKNLNTQQQAAIAKSRSSNKNVDAIMKEQEKESKDFMTRFSAEHTATGGQVSQKTMQDLASRTSSGLMNYDDISNQQLSMKDSNGNAVTVGNELQNMAKRDMDTAIKPYLDKINNNEKLSIPESQQVNRIFESNKDGLVGDTAALNKFDSLGIDTSSLQQSRDQRANTAISSIQGISNAIQNQSPSASSVSNGIDLNMETQTNATGVTKYTGRVDGVNVNGNMIANKEDYESLDSMDRKSFDEYQASLILTLNDLNTNNKFKGKIAQSQVKQKTKQVKTLIDDLNNIKNKKA